jgi:hypothetical protein
VDATQLGHHLYCIVFISQALRPPLGPCYTTYWCFHGFAYIHNEQWQNIYVPLNIIQLQIYKSALRKHSHIKQATVWEWACVFSYSLGEKCKNAQYLQLCNCSWGCRSTVGKPSSAVVQAQLLCCLPPVESAPALCLYASWLPCTCNTFTAIACVILYKHWCDFM